MYRIIIKSESGVHWWSRPTNDIGADARAAALKAFRESDAMLYPCPPLTVAVVDLDGNPIREATAAAE